MEHQLATQSTQKEQLQKPASSSMLQPKPAERAMTHPVLQLQRAIGNQAVQHMVRSGGMGLQNRPIVNGFGPKAQTPASPTTLVLQRKCACGETAESLESTEECAECKAKREANLQRSANNQATSSEPKTAPPIVHDVLRSAGHPLDSGTRSFMEPHFGHDFSQIPIHSPRGAVPQTKLKVNQPGDVYEREADQVADQVMRMPDKEPLASDEEDEAKTSLMRKQSSQTGNHAGTDMHNVPPIVHDVLNGGGGQPLDDSTRAFMEPRFGHDFSQVHIHTDQWAAESARSVNALAYTVGQDIVFNSGQYAPDSHAGRKLLAHELTHVVQQRQGLPLRTEGEPERPGSPASARLARQRDAGNGPLANDLLQRKDAENSGVATTSPPSIDFRLFSWSISITTHSGLAALARLLVHQLDLDLEGIPDSSPVRERATDWIAWVQFWLPYLDKHGAEPLTQDIVDKAGDYIKQRSKILEDITNEKQLPVREALRRARDEAALVEEELKALQPKLDDGLRAAYRSEKPSVIQKALQMIGTSLELGHAISHLSREIAEEVAEWKELHLPEVSKFAEGLGKLAKGMAAINLALELVEEKRATELEEGMRLVGLAGETFAAAASILAFPPDMILYANLYLMPAIKIITAQIGRLVELFHEENVAWVELTGELYRCDVEPGGCSMFDFMLKVMRASSDNDVPLLTDPVKKYLLDHREQLEAGTEEEVPTTGWWFWRDIESGKAREWMFANRRRIWAMFYGSMPVPEQRGSK